MTTAHGAVLDTNVFGADLAGKGHSLSPHLLTAVSFVTVAEAQFGAYLANWGPGRLATLDAHIAAVDVVLPNRDGELVDIYVGLRVRCTRDGHALGSKIHEADRWIAATAL